MLGAVLLFTTYDYKTAGTAFITAYVVSWFVLFVHGGHEVPRGPFEVPWDPLDTKGVPLISATEHTLETISVALADRTITEELSTFCAHRQMPAGLADIVLLVVVAHLALGCGVS